jgi:hypothetical protein
MKVRFGCALLLSLCAASARGQSGPETGKVYVVGSFFMSAQPPDPVDRGSDGIGGVAPAAAIVVGLPRGRFAIEGEINLAGAITARQVRLLREFTASHRDTVLSAVVRYRPGPQSNKRTTFEPFGGVSFARGTTTLTQVFRLVTFCSDGVRHCEVPAPDEELASQTDVGSTVGLDGAVTMTRRSTLLIGARLTHFFGRDTDPYSLGLASTLLRFGIGMRFGF